ncbi:hypothetical protein [Streptomyces avermitilis]|uniref:hypothetical protein n=1 Tax=Streptomyces avermitilis TaxID=33903 RepID=UPI0033BA0BF5
MTSLETFDWYDLLTRCGLQVVEDPVADGITPIEKAIQAASGVTVEPTATIPLSSSEAMEELDLQWHHYASFISLRTTGGEFLIIPPGPGGSKVGWVEVKDPYGHSLPSRVCRETGSPEFLALSTDGRHLCAVTVEDEDYWVVTHEFS